MIDFEAGLRDVAGGGVDLPRPGCCSPRCMTWGCRSGRRWGCGTPTWTRCASEFRYVAGKTTPTGAVSSAHSSRGGRARRFFFDLYAAYLLGEISGIDSDYVFVNLSRPRSADRCRTRNAYQIIEHIGSAAGPTGCTRTCCATPTPPPWRRPAGHRPRSPPGSGNLTPPAPTSISTSPATTWQTGCAAPSVWCGRHRSQGQAVRNVESQRGSSREVAIRRYRCPTGRGVSRRAGRRNSRRPPPPGHRPLRRRRMQERAVPGLAAPRPPANDGIVLRALLPMVRAGQPAADFTRLSE